MTPFRSLKAIYWQSTGRAQQTLARHVELTGKGLHSGKVSTVRIWPEVPGRGRCFHFPNSKSIPASIDFVEESPLCTTLSKDGVRVRTVEHLLSALEAAGVDNCNIHITNSDSDHTEFEVPILDGSAREWVEAIEKAGIVVAKDDVGRSCVKFAPHLREPVRVWKKDSFVAAFPSPNVGITYGIHFPQVSAIGCQWFTCASLDRTSYIKQIAQSRTFCIYEQVEHIRNAGLIKGGSLDNAIVCSFSKGWLNPPLHFHDEPCRHKVLDLVGDLSLFAQCGNQGLPVAHIVAYKGGHALHADFIRHLNQSFKS